MKLIKFRRLNRRTKTCAIRRFEIAFNEAHLHAKLDGEMAEVHMPAQGIFMRLRRRFFPLKGIEMQADGIERGVTL